MHHAHPHIGGLILALTDEPQHHAAFQTGLVGEQTAAASLGRRTREHGVVILHNRRVPGARGDIDHVAVAPSSVWVIDTKAWKGRLEIARSWFGPPKLLINRRDCTNLIAGLERQLAVVRAALDTAGGIEIPLHGALCFTKADLPWLRTQVFRGHLLAYPGALAKRLNASGPLSSSDAEQLTRELALALPPR